EIVELEHEADMLAAELRQLALAGAAEQLLAIPHLSAARAVETTEDVEQCRLAAARGAEQDNEFTGVQIEIHAAQRMDLDLAHGIDTGEATGSEHGRRGIHGGFNTMRHPRTQAGTRASLIWMWQQPAFSAIITTPFRSEALQEDTMRASRCRIPFAFVVFSLLCFASLQGQAQDIPREQLAATLASGGHVIVMRHANSPRELPDANTVNADNVSGERQLDDSGRRDALAMGEALRRLGIPVSEVLSSPTYRAMETVRLLGFTATPVEQLGNEGMRAAAEAWTAWLQAEVARAVSGGNR